MIIEVSILDEGEQFDVQVWDTDEEELEKTFDTEKEASDYVV